MQQQAYDVHQAWGSLFSASTVEGLQQNMKRFVGLTYSEQRFVVTHLLHTLLLQSEQRQRELDTSLQAVIERLSGLEAQVKGLRELVLSRDVREDGILTGELGLPRASALLIGETEDELAEDLSDGMAESPSVHASHAEV